MREDVLQAVAICCHGNAFFFWETPCEAPELFGQNRTFARVEEVVFERRPAAFSSRAKPTELACATAPWLRRLQHEGVQRLELRLAKCSFDPAKRQPGTWGLVSDGDLGLELWHPTWKSRSRGYGESPVWKVRYVGERTERTAPGTTAGVRRASEMLESALVEALTVANYSNAPLMRTALERCLDLHSSDGQEAQTMLDLAPSSLPQANQRLLSSAVRCVLVMSSEMWDPGGVPDTQRSSFEVTSQFLWKCCLTAFEAAANAWPVNEQRRMAAG